MRTRSIHPQPGQDRGPGQLTRHNPAAARRQTGPRLTTTTFSGGSKLVSNLDMNKAAMSIGNPPRKVTQSFRRVGEWQLHLVRERISFRCVLCGEQREDALWAATRYDSSQELACQPCYRGVLRKHYSMEPDASQSGPKPSKKELARERSRRLAYERWHRRLPGVDSVISFFQSAGVAAELLPDGRLRVNGGETRPLSQILPPPGTFDWSEVIVNIQVPVLRAGSGG